MLAHDYHCCDRESWSKIDTDIHDYDTSGAPNYRYHPPGLPKAMPSESDFENPVPKISCATRTFAAVHNHGSWRDLFAKKEADKSALGLRTSTMCTAH